MFKQLKKFYVRKKKSRKMVLKRFKELGAPDFVIKRQKRLCKQSFTVFVLVWLWRNYIRKFLIIPIVYENIVSKIALMKLECNQAEIDKKCEELLRCLKGNQN